MTDPYQKWIEFAANSKHWTGSSFVQELAREVLRLRKERDECRNETFEECLEIVCITNVHRFDRHTAHDVVKHFRGQIEALKTKPA